MCMTDPRSMLFAQPGAKDALHTLSEHAFVMWFCDVVHQSDGPVDVHHVVNTLASGEGLFIDVLSTLGATQEAVMEALELLVERRIRVFVLDEGKRILEITPEIVQLTRSFQRLDIVLINRTAA
jgi:hypothetical protein